MAKGKKNKGRKGRIRIPTKELVELIGSLLAAGNPPEDIPRLVGQFFDDLIAFDEVVDGPVGGALELVDGLVFTAAAKVIISVFPTGKLIERAAA